jgi:predicted amidohydrolase
VPIVETPFGRLATLVCYDAFGTPHTKVERFVQVGHRLAARTPKLAIIANPAANPWPWQKAWPHGEGTREQQWAREGLVGTMSDTPIARFGVTAHLVGKILDLSFDGQSEIVERTPSGVVRLARAERHDRGGCVTAVVSC